MQYQSKADPATKRQWKGRRKKSEKGLTEIEPETTERVQRKNEVGTGRRTEEISRTI